MSCYFLISREEDKVANPSRYNSVGESLETCDLLWRGCIGKIAMAAWVGGGFDEEFEEGEVWGKERDGGDESKKKVSSGSSSSAWHLPAAPRKIPRANTQSSHESGHHVVQGSSAPLDIPDWSKIYQKNGKKKESKIYGEEEDNSGGGGGEDDDDDDDGMMIPPHEWIARKLARSQISSFSVCEGVGRTLKGRDLSKVRNAILTKTGFIE